MESPKDETIRLTPAEALKMVEAIMMPCTPSDRAKATAKLARLVFGKLPAQDYTPILKDLDA